MNFFQRAIGHFKTITKHRHQVIIHCKKAGILWQGMFHDLSKYTPTEFCQGVRFYTGTKSPNEGERDLYGYSIAWLHHKGRNKHHFEYWMDYSPITHKMEPIRMPYNYVIEMFCDRVAASKIYNGDKYTQSDALDYFNRRKEHRCIHPETSKALEELLTMLAKEGEEKTFEYIRNSMKSNY
ncbi:MAG: catalase [Lachnospiraceae bacterium]|nr:catalase [Lachnospiraceae bacterium]